MDENMNDDTNKERLERLIQRELDGEILPEEEAELQQALTNDEALSATYAADRRLSAMFAEDRGQIEVPSDLASRIAGNVLKSEEAAPLGRRFDLMAYLKPIAIAASVVLLMGYSFYLGGQQTSAVTNDGFGDMTKKMEQLLEEHPELDRKVVEAHYKSCEAEIRNAQNDAESRQQQALSDLENKIQKLVLKAQIKDAERK